MVTIRKLKFCKDFASEKCENGKMHGSIGLAKRKFRMDRKNSWEFYYLFVGVFVKKSFVFVLKSYVF